MRGCSGGWRPSPVRPYCQASLAVADPALGVPLENVAHIIQVALTPVFLLSGVGTLLNVFSTRLARITDHMEHAEELLRAHPEGLESVRLRSHLHRLRRRTFALDVAVAMGAVGGAATAVATLTLFVGALRDAGVASALFLMFGLAVACTIVALTAFLAETVLSWHGLRDEGPLPRPKLAPRA